MYYERKSFIWWYAAFWLLFINYCKTETIQEIIQSYNSYDDMRLFEVTVLFGWSILKSLSFTLDYIEVQQLKHNKSCQGAFDLINMLAYSFYFPNLVVGPILIYSR